MVDVEETNGNDATFTIAKVDPQEQAVAIVYDNNMTPYEVKTFSLHLASPVFLDVPKK